MEESDGSDLAQRETKPDAGAVAVASAPKIGVLAWSFVGVVVATIIVVTAFGYVSEILLPLLFAAVLAVIFKPMVGSLERHGFKPSLGGGSDRARIAPPDDRRIRRDGPGRGRSDG